MLGLHIIAEFHGVDPEILDNKELLEKVFIEAAEYAGSNVLGAVFHKFNPHGVTGIVAISESHISIHTWPEFGYAAIDAFSCRAINPRRILTYLLQVLKPKKAVIKEIARGVEYNDGKTPDYEIIEEKIIQTSSR